MVYHNGMAIMPAMNAWGRNLVSLYTQAVKKRDAGTGTPAKHNSTRDT